MKFIEQIERRYLNGVTIKYEIINDTTIYINSIYSVIRHNGNATEALQCFLIEFSNKDIYLYASAELGTDINILNKLYDKLGFKHCSNTDSIQCYNVNYLKKAEI